MVTRVEAIHMSDRGGLHTFQSNPKVEYIRGTNAFDITR